MSTVAMKIDPDGALCIAAAHKMAEFAVALHPDGRPPSEFLLLLQNITVLNFGSLVMSEPAGTTEDIDFLTERTADIFASRYRHLCQLYALTHCDPEGTA